MQDTLIGYEVATFIRIEAELVGIVNHEPFSQTQVSAAQALKPALIG
jgi:hypothetical protein